MKLLFYDGFDKCSKCIYLLGIELLELIGKSIHSIGRFLTEIEKFLWSYVEVLTYIKEVRHGRKKFDMVGKVVPHSIARIYPGFCPMERLMSLADTPFFVRSSASRLENCSSYMSNHHPSLLYCSLEDSQK